jgi:transcriptional regulator with XRE-family HTH domain
MSGDFDLSGGLRRIRRIADLSQRQLAGSLGISAAAIAHAEAGTRDLPATVLARAATLAGLRLVLLDAEGCEVSGMADEAVRDMGGRRFPAHLDTRYADEGWWHDAHHWTRPKVWYTFSLDRDGRDGRRRALGTPDDHPRPRPGDSPRDRAGARRLEAERRRRDELQHRFLAGELRDAGPGWTCGCPPECAELDLGERPVHAAGCPCGCDIG